MKGEVVGINTAIISRTGVNAGIGLAIPSNMARRIMQQLVEGGRVVRGYLGVQIQNVDEKLTESFGLPHGRGVLVSQVYEDAPADEAGLQAGDFIVSVDGKATQNVNELRNRVAGLAPGTTVELALYRDGKKKTLRVRIGKQPEDFLAAGPGEPSGPEPAARLGVTVQQLTAELAKRFGHPGDLQGVVITAVDAQSDAAEKGLQVGAVITHVQGRAVTTVEQFRQAVAAAKADGVRLRVRGRDGGQRFVFLEFSE
jgi:serine protease Do